jgi:hypothetical protein
MGSNSTGTAVAVAVGAGLAITSGTLASTVASLPDSANLLGTNSGGTATAVVVSTGLTLSAGTLSAGGQSYAAGIDISISSGTISLAAPSSAAVLSSNSGGSLVALTLGGNLLSTGGTLKANIPASAALLASNSGGTPTAIVLGSNLSVSSGTLNASGGGTLPNSAPLLASNSGGTATSVALGTNLTSSSGTLSVSVPVSEPLLGSTSGGSFSGVAVGSGLTLSSGTLTASGGNPPTWTRPRLSAFTQRGTASSSTLTTLSEPFGAAGPVKMSILGTGTDPFVCALAESVTANSETMFTCSFTVAAFQTGGGNYWRYGALLEDSSGILFAINFLNNNGSYVIEEVSYTSYTAYGTEVTTFTLYPNIVNLWLRFYVNQTSTPSIHVMMSNDGISWSELLVTTTPPSSFNMASIAYAAVYGDNGSVWRVEASYNHFDIQYGTGNSLNRYAAVNPL